MNKQELITKVERAHSEWQSLLAEVGEARMEEHGVMGDWSVKDIIAHITAWEERLMARMESEATGTPLEMAGWDMDKMNDQFYNRNRDRSFKDILTDSHATHERFMSFIHSLSEDDLFEGGRYKWTDGNPLYHWVEGNTYEHYDEHAAFIQAWLDRRVVGSR